MKKGLLLIGLIMVACLMGCNEEAPNEVTIASELKEHFDAFVEEGGKRGVTVDYSKYGISANISAIDQNNVAGKCLKYSDGRRALLFDRNYWNKASYLQREFLVFHELGHCMLNRDHDERVNQRGVCVSMMTSGKSDCSINYTNATRSSYLDELFN